MKRVSISSRLAVVVGAVLPVFLGSSLLADEAAAAAPAVKIDSGATAWMLASSALVLFMTPGLALFYAGMVRSKNVLGTAMHSLFCMGLITLQWVIVGYSLSFSDVSCHGLFGNLKFLFLNGVAHDQPAVAAGTTYPISQLVHMVYQMMFAIITPALITGAFAERVRFGPYVLFMLLWSTLVYDPLA